MAADRTIEISPNAARVNTMLDGGTACGTFGIAPDVAFGQRLSLSLARLDFPD